MTKKPVILDLSFGFWQGTHQYRQGVNGDTLFKAAPPCEMGQIGVGIVF